MIPVNILGPRSSKTILALVDDGSTVTIIGSRIVNELGVKTTSANILLQGVGGESSVMLCSEKADVTLESETGIFIVRSVLVAKDLVLSVQRMENEIVDFCASRTGVLTAPYEAAPEMIIGQDNCRLILTREYYALERHDLVVSRCNLGWSIHGLTCERTLRNVNAVGSADEQRPPTRSDEDAELNALVRSYFDIDGVGVTMRMKANAEDTRALKILDSTSIHTGQYWEVGLRWRADEEMRDNGKYIAINRLNLLEKRLDRDSKYARLYYGEIERLMKKGFAKRVDRDPYLRKSR